MKKLVPFLLVVVGLLASTASKAFIVLDNNSACYYILSPIIGNRQHA